MPQVPIYDKPRVTLQGVNAPALSVPQGLGRDFQAEQFGQVVQAATGAIKAADAIVDDLAKEREANDVMQTRAGFLGEWNQFSNQLQSTEGVNARGAREKGAAKYAELRQSWLSKVQSPRARRALEHLLDRDAPGQIDTLDRHERAQEKSLLRKNAEAQIATATDTAVSNFTNPETVAQALDDAVRAARVNADSAGLEPDARDAYLQKVTSGFHKAMTDRLMSVSASKAREYFEAHADQIDSDTSNTILKNLKTADVRTQSQAAADEIFAKGLTESQALKQAREIDDPEVRDETVVRLRGQYAEKLRADREDGVDATDDAYSIIANGGTIDDIPEDLWNRVPGQSQLALRRYEEKEGHPTRSDPQTYSDLIFRYTDTPEEFGDRTRTNLIEYVDRLSPSDFQYFTQLQAGMRQPGSKPQYDTLLTDTQVVNNALIQAGLDPKDRNKDNRKGMQIANFISRMDQDFRSESSELGRKLTPDERQKIVDRHTIMVLREGTIWDSNIPAGLIEIEGVPKESIDEIAAMLRDKGVAVTEANIKRVWDIGMQESQK